MNFLQRVIAALSLGIFALAANATPTNPVSGSDYRTLDTPQQTDSGKKVEVTEFFGYFCPHCNSFEPALVDWVKKQGDNIVFKRVPIAFNDAMAPQQRLFYALEAMGKADEFQRKVFNAIHVERQSLNTDFQIIEFVVKQGIDKAKFTDLFNSFTVQTKVRRAVQLQGAYKVDGVPFIAIDGRFVTSPSIVGTGIGEQPEAVLQVAALQVMDALVSKVMKERKASAAGAKAAPVSAVVTKSSASVAK
jgi:thiol:disulfide interchange protein DsbA